MAKLIVFCGSPRKNGFTPKLINEVIRGARSKGMEVSYYDLNDPGVRGCQGCYYCRSNEGCSIKDDTLATMYQEIKEADAILFGSPIYFYQITGQAKMWLDRMFPMIGSPGLTARYPGKKAVTIFTQGSSDISRNQNVVDEINGYLKGFGWEMIDSMIVAGSSDSSYEIPEELMAQAFRAGEGLA